MKYYKSQEMYPYLGGFYMTYYRVYRNGERMSKLIPDKLIVQDGPADLLFALAKETPHYEEITQDEFEQMCDFIAGMIKTKE